MLPTFAFLPFVRWGIYTTRRRTMQRLKSIQPETANDRAKQLLAQVEQAFGSVPNTAKVMANSPAVLESFLAFSSAMGQAKIGDKLHHQVKLNTSETNSCDYCTSILCAIGSIGRPLGRRCSRRSFRQLRRPAHRRCLEVRRGGSQQCRQGRQRSTRCRPRRRL